MTQSASGSTTHAVIQTTEEVTVVPRIVTQSEQVARYFTEDLERLLQETHMNLVKELDIPTEYGYSTRDVIYMLFDDISHMIRDRIITRIRLILSDPDIDKNIGAYPIRYQAIYQIDIPDRSLRDTVVANNVSDRTLRQPSHNTQSQQDNQPTTQRINGYLSLPDHIWIGAKLALLIDWNTSANERRRSARRPEYSFDWIPANERYDDTTLIRFRDGGMAYDGATIVQRREYKSPGYKQ